MTEYKRRDPVLLGEHYTRHVEAMTAEGLHCKSDIAAELAWRDAEIERLREETDRTSEWLDILDEASRRVRGCSFDGGQEDVIDGITRKDMDAFAWEASKLMRRARSARAMDGVLLQLVFNEVRKIGEAPDGSRFLLRQGYPMLSIGHDDVAKLPDVPLCVTVDVRLRDKLAWG